jgi:hypothetical protein
MFSAIRKRLHLTPSTAIAIVALVFALTGGAYAASRVIITSKSQINTKVLKELAKDVANLVPAGKAGAPGGPGAAGAGGAQGPQGVAGTNGTPGEEGAKGDTGVPGPEGSPWTAGGKLPSKKTETGTWSATAGPFAASAGGSLGLASISYTIPLSHAVQVKIEPEGYEGDKAECPSTTEELEEGAVAKAAPGTLCVYPFNGILGEELSTLVNSVNGAVLIGKVEESLAGIATYGAWAVTAE